MKTLAVLLSMLLPAVGSALSAQDVLLFHTDFSNLSPGKFGELAVRAFPEYHHVPRKFTGGWEVVNNRGPEEWKVFNIEGRSMLEYLGYNKTVWTWRFTYPILVYGDPLWGDYTMEAEITPISRRDVADYMGIIFRYQDGRHYYFFGFGPADSLLLRYRDGEKAFNADGWYNLGVKKFPVDRTRACRLRAEAYDNRIRCYIDGEMVFNVRDDHFKGGKIGLLACSPVRYTEISVSTTEEAESAFLKRARKHQADLDSLRMENPRPVLWKRIPTKGFGAHRAMRLGDLDGDGRLDFLIAQNINYFDGNYNHISCLTAVDVDGRILWQKGTPNPDHAWVNYDVAMQIHDIDDDGWNEVVYAQERWVKVLDGRTGKLEARFHVPESKIQAGEISWYEYKHYYRRDHLPYLNVDCISFCDLRGTGKPLDIIIKDRHTRIWTYNNKFELLWTATANLGHFPYFYDLDKDGRDEVFLGYSMFDDDGSLIWNLDSRPRGYEGEMPNNLPSEERLDEHADGICVGDWSLSGREEKVFISASDDGVAVLDKNGKMLKHHRVGHAQSPSFGQYRPDIPGLEYCNINYWGEAGLVTLYSAEGEEIINFELIHQGSPILPVNWCGDGVEYFMLSANTVLGGLVDGWGRRVVRFPDDGHPDLAYFVEDITGDQRDEIIVWDTEWIYIYTQNNRFEGDTIYAPRRSPTYNESNYRATISWPAWKEVRR
jgi:rhamnogalacturonan endolyase